MSTLLASLLLAGALAGCTADDGVDKAQETDTTPTTQTSPTPTMTTQATEPAPAPLANLTSDVANGTAPLTVTFNIANDEANATVTGWTLEFGDGNDTTGTEVPSTATHTYEVAGNYTAVLTLQSEAGNGTDSLPITAEGGDNGGGPSQTEYSSGPVMGCVTELDPGGCPAYVLGPGNEDGWGLWIELEPGHVGMKFTVHSLGGDSDGWLFAEPDGDPLAEAHNGGEEATGVITAEHKWLLVISWVAPSDDLVVTFE